METETMRAPSPRASSGRAAARGGAVARAASGSSSARRADVALELADNARWLWGVCYRMTGSSADADDLVQETFVRAMERPPARTDEPIGPWLLRVAVNLGRDALRRRKRRRYVGTWLPAAVEMEEIAPLEIEGEGGTEGRYDLLESVSFAFLLALEVLTPNQRAVLVLRDVLERSVRETADMLGLSEANVKVLHHRARKALAPYEEGRDHTRPTKEVVKSSEAALQRFLTALSTGDEAALMGVLASGASAWSDGGGQFLASKIVVSGADRVARMFLGLTRKGGPVERFTFRMLNGAPAFVAERTAHRATDAPRFVMACDVDRAGRIVRIYSVLASDKLSHVRPVTQDLPSRPPPSRPSWDDLDGGSRRMPGGRA
jgi:RNA polymerase sigma-70 factor (ECF subfamily)